MPDIRDTEKFRRFAAELRRQCDERGVRMADDRTGDFLAAQLERIAVEQGETQQQVLDRYLELDGVPTFVDAIVEVVTHRREATDTVDPVTLEANGVARVITALSMVMKLAVDELQRPGNHVEALSVAADGSAALVNLGTLLRDAEAGETLELGGPVLVGARRVLHRAIEYLGDGTWKCPYDDRHSPGDLCRLRTTIAGELGVIGGWAGGFHEPPADER